MDNRSDILENVRWPECIQIRLQRDKNPLEHQVVAGSGKPITLESLHFEFIDPSAVPPGL